MTFERIVKMNPAYDKRHTKTLFSAPPASGCGMWAPGQYRQRNAVAEIELLQREDV